MSSAKRLLVTKEPRWMKYVGAVFVIIGSFALIPFNVEYLEMFDGPMYVVGSSGVILLIRAAQKIGWHLMLEGNVLFYSKFNMYSSWKRIRSQEFALAKNKITRVTVTTTELIIHYHPNRVLNFSLIGLSQECKNRVIEFSNELST